ncbi:MAG TPA: rhamnulokinase family protein [Candidatus Limnocylindrales bacterium]
MPLRLLALDLGAESGRGMVGTLDGERLALAESYRFPNVPVRLGETLHWDFLRLFGDALAAIRKAAAEGPLRSVGVDTWGVDFGLLDERGRLIGNPVHYRDRRTEGILDIAFGRVPRPEIYRATGIQFMGINTLYQLLAMSDGGDPQLGQARRLLMMPDLFHFFLTGRTAAEYTIASTSQCLDPVRRQWATGLLERFGIPTHILPEIVPPGSELGVLGGDVAERVGATGIAVVAPGAHDTASAVAGTPLEDPRTTAFLSSGTWSLIGLEVHSPVLSDAALAANLTNEGGVEGTIRLLKNVVGLWLVQESRRALWPAGDAPTYEELTGLARHAPPFMAFIDPDDERFLRPGNLPARIHQYCLETGQDPPIGAGPIVRVLLESLALRYATVVDELAAVSGHPLEAIHVVGGGANNDLLCQLTADATGRTVRAGPVEATALGNIAVQAIAAGELASVGEARQLIGRSFPSRAYEPSGDWTEARDRFERLVSARRAAAQPA